MNDQRLRLILGKEEKVDVGKCLFMLAEILRGRAQATKLVFGRPFGALLLKTKQLLLLFVYLL
jgi:hypothetical protein